MLLFLFFEDKSESQNLVMLGFFWCFWEAGVFVLSITQPNQNFRECKAICFISFLLFSLDLNWTTCNSLGNSSLPPEDNNRFIENQVFILKLYLFSNINVKQCPYVLPLHQENEGFKFNNLHNQCAATLWIICSGLK